MKQAARMLNGLQLMQQAVELQASGKPAEAAAAFSRAYSLMPEHPQLLAAYATLAEEVKDWAAAEKLYRQLGALRPQSNFEGKLGLCIFRQERYSEAIPYFLAHLERHPNEPALQLPLAQALCKEKKWEEALMLGRGLLALHPGEATWDVVLNSLFNLARKNEFDALLENALIQQANSPFIMALCGMHLLKSFDHRRGFAFQQAMRRRYEKNKPTHARPAADGWNGKPFDGVLLIEGEQGLGEEILGASMFKDLLRTGQRAIISCEPRLLPLFRRSFPALEFVSRLDDDIDRIAASGIRFHRFQSIDLACLFRRDDSFPDDKSWLVPDPDRVKALRERYVHDFPGQRLAGISWKSRREFTGGPDKNIALTHLAPALTLPGYTWFNLQYGETQDDTTAVAALGITPPRTDPSIDASDDIDGLAAQMAALDCVVSTSNTTAHLAGALGVTCYLLLPKARPVLWYWGYEGAQTPWYPHTHILRNPDENSWEKLAENLAAELRGN